MSHFSASPAIVRCEFQHAVFSSFGEVRFRRSDTDGTPIMAIVLGEREAQLPLAALRRQFGIDDSSPDGRMLDLIGSALDYVPVLSPGDKLPSEVLTGEASWRPSPKHFKLATTRMYLNLVAWLAPSSTWARAERDEITLLRLADDEALLMQVNALAIPAAHHLGLPDAATVLGRVGEVAGELAFIEALRQRLLGRVEALCRRMAGILADRRRNAAAPSDTMEQVHRLAQSAFQQLNGRFDDVDAQTGEFGSLMRNIDSQRQFIRTNRDWLYRNQRIWDTLLGQWEGLGDDAKEVAALLGKTYQFLAPRFMPTKQWQQPQQQERLGRSSTKAPARLQMAW